MKQLGSTADKITVYLEQGCGNGILKGETLQHKVNGVLLQRGKEGEVEEKTF